MTIPEAIALMEHKRPPAPEAELAAFEADIGCRLPEEYREFLIATNGGTLGRNADFCGFREESNEEQISLLVRRERYQQDELRVPKDLIWFMDDAFGNGMCIGITGEERGKIYFWEHEEEGMNGEDWDGLAATACNLQFIANSFPEFISQFGAKEAGAEE